MADCNAAAGAMSHAMQQAMANAAAAQGMTGAMPHDMMDQDEAWAHDFVMHPHAHQHQHPHAMFHHHHHHHHHHADPMAMAGGEDWANQYDHHAGAHEQVHEDALQSALEAAHAEAEMENAYAEAEGAAVGGMDDWIEQFRDTRHEGEEWADDYNDTEVKVYGVNGEEPPTVQEKDANSDFHRLMGDIQTGQVVIEEDGQVQDPSAVRGEADAMAAGMAAEAAAADEDWAEGYGADDAEQAMRKAWMEAAGEETGEDFATEMMARERELAAEAAAGQALAADGEQWAREMEEQEEDYAEEFFGEGDDWLKEYEALTKRANEAQNTTDYPFESNNPYLFHDDPFMEGQELLAAGTLSEAVLAFEAACQKDATVVENWQFLGTTQAENEKDGLAIIALNNAVKLCPTNLHALGALAVCHTNESNHALAMQTLREWIANNENYPGIVDAVGAVDDMDVENLEDHFVAEYLFVDSRQHKHVTAMYEAALEMNPADVELHKALGVLHNLSNQYDRAADNFRNALKVAPEDEKLWNKLGATLANGNRPRDAIEAYNRALDINPGFVRAHFNLGIAFSNSGDHVNAARQFIRAIVMQQGGVEAPASDNGPPRSTREIWDVLRMTLNLMDKPDLVDVTWQHDIRPFVQEFGLHDLNA
jgi:peroxin-5